MTRILLFKYSLFLIFLNQVEATSRLAREVFFREAGSEKNPFKEWSLRNPTGKSLNERLQENRDYYILGEGSDEIDADLRMPFIDKTSIDEPVELTGAQIDRFIRAFEASEGSPVKCLSCTVLVILIEPEILSKYAGRLRGVFLNLKNIQTARGK